MKEQISSSSLLRLENFGFAALCLILIVNPIPFASNRDWAWGSLGLLAALLFFFLILNKSFYQDNLIPKLKPIKIEVIIIISWLLIQLIYLIPLPVFVLEMISPTVASAYKSLGLESGYLTLDYYATLKTLLLSVYFTVVFLLCLTLIRSRKKALAIVLLFLSLAVFEVIYGLYLISIGKNGMFFDLRTVATNHLAGTYINKNHLVAFLSLSFHIVLAYRLYLVEKFNLKYPIKSKRWLKKLSSPIGLIDVCLLILIGGVWATHSKAGLIAFIFSFMLFVVFYLVFVKKKLLTFKSIIGLVLFCVLFLLFSSNDIDVILTNMGFYSENGLEHLSSAAEGRKLALQQFFEHWDKYWLFGTGPGSYEVFFVNHRSVEQLHYFDHAHNDYIEFVIEYGCFSILLLSLLLVVMWRLLKVIRKSKSKLHSLFGICGIASIIYMLIHGLFDFNTRIPANVIALITAISLSYREYLDRNIE